MPDPIPPSCRKLIPSSCRIRSRRHAGLRPFVMPGSDPASRPGKEIAGQARNDGKDSRPAMTERLLPRNDGFCHRGDLYLSSLVPQKRPIVGERRGVKPRRGVLRQGLSRWLNTDGGAVKHHFRRCFLTRIRRPLSIRICSRTNTGFHDASKLIFKLRRPKAITTFICLQII